MNRKKYMALLLTIILSFSVILPVQASEPANDLDASGEQTEAPADDQAAPDPQTGTEVFDQESLLAAIASHDASAGAVSGGGISG